MVILVLFLIYFLSLIVTTSLMTLIFKPSFVPAIEFIEVSGIQFWSAIWAFVLTLIVCRVFYALKFKLFRSPVDKPPDFYESVHVRRVRKEMERLKSGGGSNNT